MFSALHNRRILLIISGGIAAYKSLDLIRRMREEGARVRCVLTAGGAQFITPLSVSALSEEQVYSDLWSLTDEQQMGHIRLSREADIVVVAPASANLIAKMANGIADDLASTVLLATNKPVFVAPAMNVMMWENAATSANIALLQKRGVKIIGPDNGSMACGETGAGRMSEPNEILSTLRSHFELPGPLKGLMALVTSGPTYEPLDPVRFLGNRSSGKQGHAIAQALHERGAETVLVTGPTVLPDIAGIKTIKVETAREMLAACEQALPVDIAICAAAVADWRPQEASLEKLKKGSTKAVLELTENPDILANLAKDSNQRPRLVIGFAAETSHVVERARQKLDRKACDWIIANEVASDKGFGENDNQVTLLRRGENNRVVESAWPLQSKDEIARRLVLEIIDYFTAA